MKIYELLSDLDNYQNLGVKDEDHFYINKHFHERKPLRDLWVPLHISILHFKQRGINYGTLPLNDYPRIGGMPVFSKKAVDCLSDVLLENGEILPLLFEGKEGIYFAFNQLRDIDALDEARSDLARFEDGRIMRVIKYVFRPSKLAGETLFKIPQEKGRLYVTDTFVDRVKDCSLTGFSYRLIWSDYNE